MADEAPRAEATAAPRAEMGDAAPVLSWRAIYAIVLGALAVEVIVGAILTALYS
ncbi:MAG TPA: hypothetical protein VHM31_18165 [Polyangia bacterium]|nr:hypothetical protein [Polyangia bacterium]